MPLIQRKLYNRTLCWFLSCLYLGGSPFSSSSLYCNLHEDVCLSILLPSKLHTAPVRESVCPISSDLTATGAEQPPPSVLRKLLSASTRKVVVPWNNGSRSLRVVKSSSLHSIARAPWPTAYNSSSASNCYKHSMFFCLFMVYQMLLSVEQTIYHELYWIAKDAEGTHTA